MQKAQLLYENMGKSTKYVIESIQEGAEKGGIAGNLCGKFVLSGKKFPLLCATDGIGAFWQSGGTAFTVDYVKKQNVHIVIPIIWLTGKSSQSRRLLYIIYDSIKISPVVQQPPEIQAISFIFCLPDGKWFTAYRDTISFFSAIFKSSSVSRYMGKSLFIIS